MTDILLNHITTYGGLSASQYFKIFEGEFQKNINLENLTTCLSSDKNHYTEKPYLYRRQVKSSDKRFDSFEIVHDESNAIKAIVFNVNIKLSELENLFGQAFIKNEPYSNSTAFIFDSKNPDIEIIKTRHPEWLTKKKDSDYEFFIDNTADKIVDPKFSFVQFDIQH